VQYTSSISVNMNNVVRDFESKEATKLKEELNKLMIFWFTNKNNVHQHKKIETAYIAGEHADSPGVQEFLERSLGINIELANVWSNCFSSTDFVPKISRDDSLKYAIAVGMAMKGIRQK
jgi:Tfp pilus assembly PilM family ATPase